MPLPGAAGPRRACRVVAVAALLLPALIGVALPTAYADPPPTVTGLPSVVVADLDATELHLVHAALSTRRDAVTVDVAAVQDDRLTISTLRAAPTRVDALVDTLRGQPAVESAGIDQTMAVLDTADPLRSLQWPLDRLHADAVWGTARTQAAALPVVAVVDTGMQGDHPDLQGVPVDGYDFVTGGATPAGTSVDPNGHGTHVSGIMAATVGNGVGVAGLVPGLRVMPVRVLDGTGAGSSAAVAQGIVWAVDHGARVVNLSLGGSASSVMETAVAYADAHAVLVVAAAGNDGTGANTLAYPCAYVSVLCVAATASDDTVAPFSTHGPQVDIAAPGAHIASTYNGSTYAYMSGTSMATPYAAAAAAFVWAGQPASTPEQLRSTLTATADDLATPGPDEFSGAGLIDPGAAYASGGPTAPPAAAAPEPPAGFTAALTGSTATLQWTSSAGATGYRLTNAVDGAGAVTVATTGANTLTVPVAAGSSYAFSLVATGAGGESLPVAVTLGVRPAAPVVSAVSVVSAATGTTQLSWPAVRGATTYAVWRSGDTTATRSGPELSFAVPAGTLAGATFSVVAAGPTGTSLPSNAVVIASAVSAGRTPTAGRSASPAVTPPAVTISAPARLAIGATVRVSARALSGGRVVLRTSSRCTLRAGVLRAGYGTGTCTLSALSSTGATATAVVLLIRKADAVSVTPARRPTAGVAVPLKVHTRSGLGTTLAVTGRCRLVGTLLTAAAGRCTVQARTPGSATWAAASQVIVLVVAARR